MPNAAPRSSSPSAPVVIAPVISAPSTPPTSPAGPDARPPNVLYNSIINPGADIAQGFNGTQLKLKDGSEIHGLVLSEGDPVIVQSAGGLTQTVPKNRIAERKGLGRSLMLSADQLGLQPQDIADIGAWLRTR